MNDWFRLTVSSCDKEMLSKRMDHLDILKNIKNGQLKINILSNSSYH